MKTIDDLPNNLLLQVLRNLNVPQLSDIESTCRRISLSLRYAIDELSLENPEFQKYFPSLQLQHDFGVVCDCNAEKAGKYFDLNANRLMKLLCWFLLKKRLGPNLRKLRLFNNVLTAESLWLFGEHCRHLSDLLSIDTCVSLDPSVVISGFATLRLHN